MGYRCYIASPARLASLKANNMPDFASMKYVILRKEMKLRGMFDYGKKLHMIARLEGHFRWMRAEHERGSATYQVRRLRERAKLMLTSKFKAESSRVSFTDLPGEMRNMIYDLALFDPFSGKSSEVEMEDSGDYAEAGNWVIPVSIVFFFSGDPVAHLPELRTLSVLNVIAALNKQLRQEVHTFFWSRIKVDLRPSVQPSCCSLVIQFLKKIGPHGRSALAGLSAYPVSARSPDHHHLNYQAMVTFLRECKNLQTFGLYLPIHMMMGPPDRMGMENFFLHGHPLSSPSMDHLVGVLHSLPQLRSARLQMDSSMVEGIHALSNHQRYPGFLRFAFSGVREGRLVQEFRTRLRARQDVEFQIMAPVDQVELYEEWLSQFPDERLP